MRQRLRCFRAHDVDRARQHVLHRRRAAAVEHELQLGAGLLARNRGRRHARREPAPTLAAVALSGLALSQAINSLALLAGSDSLPTIISDDTGSRAIGSRSFTGFHDTGYSAGEPTWLDQLPMLSV